MEVQFTPEIQAKLHALSRDTGRQRGELVQDPVVGLFDELDFTRETLERRYCDADSGRVLPIDGEEACRYLMAKTAKRRQIATLVIRPSSRSSPGQE